MPKSFLTPDALQKLVQELPSNPVPGKTHALVGTVDSRGVQVVAVMKFKSVWELQAAARQEWGGDAQAGVKIIARW